MRAHFAPTTTSGEPYFEGGLNEVEQLDVLQKGYCSGVWVELNDGTRYQMSFYDPGRLSFQINFAIATGQKYMSEPGLTIIPEVSLANMMAAAQALAENGFFDPPSALIDQSRRGDWFFSSLEPQPGSSR